MYCYTALARITNERRVTDFGRWRRSWALQHESSSSISSSGGISCTSSGVRAACSSSSTSSNSISMHSQHESCSTACSSAGSWQCNQQQACSNAARSGASASRAVWRGIMKHAFSCYLCALLTSLHRTADCMLLVTHWYYYIVVFNAR
jgi:hypothetical protein